MAYALKKPRLCFAYRGLEIPQLYERELYDTDFK